MRITNQRRESTGGGDGFTLVEMLMSVFLCGIVFLAVAHTLGVAVVANRAVTDYTQASSLGWAKLEELSELDYAALAPGGSVAADTAGFFDNPDVDDDGAGDYTRRWEIADLGGSKRIRVRVISMLAAFGPEKETNVVTLIAAP